MKKVLNVLQTILSIVLIVLGLGFLGYKGYDKYKNIKLNKNISSKSDDIYNEIIGNDIEISKVLADSSNENPQNNITNEEKPENDEKYNKYINTLNDEFNNDDIIARIIIPKINIDYMVVKSMDNEDYLFKDIDGNYSDNGSIFLDKDSNIDFSDFNTVIYGHKMADGQMFGKLNKYLDPDFVNNGEDNYFKIITSEGEKTYKIVSSMVIDNDENVIKNVNTEEFIKEIIEKSEVEFNRPNISRNSKFVSLITCFPRNGVIDDERRIAIIAVEL